MENIDNTYNNLRSEVSNLPQENQIPKKNFYLNLNLFKN